MSNLTVNEYILQQRANITAVQGKTTEANTTTSNINNMESANITYVASKDLILDGLQTEIDDVELLIDNNDTNSSNNVATIASMKSVLEGNNQYELMFKVNGTVDKYYPVYFNIGLPESSPNFIYGLTYIDVIRTGEYNKDQFENDTSKTPIVYMRIDADTTDKCVGVPWKFKVRSFDYNNLQSIALPSGKMFCSITSDMLNCSYQHKVLSGFYVRGGLDYKIVTNNKRVIEQLITRQELAANHIHELPATTYDVVKYCPVISELDIKLYSMDENAYIYPDEYKAAPGNIALTVGGYIASNTPTDATQRSVISTGAAAIGSTGTLNSTLIDHSGTSNSVDGVGIIMGGVAAGATVATIQTVSIETDTDAVAGGNLSTTLRNASSTSNGIEDRAITSGGNDNSTGTVSTIQRSVVSNGSGATNVGVLTSNIEHIASTSNNEKDQAIVTGGHDGNVTSKFNIQQTIISTGSNATNIGDITTSLYNHTIASNGLDDVAVLCGGYAGAVATTDIIRLTMVSNGMNCRTTGSLRQANHHHSATSNAVNDTVVNTGGFETVASNAIQRSTISTGASTSTYGGLTSVLYDHISISNG